MQDISRRAFLRRSITSAVGLGVMGLPLKSWASKTHFVEAMVIGSGFGGAGISETAGPCVAMRN